MRRIVSIIFVLLVVTAILGVQSSVVARTKLHGAYAVTSARTCTVTNNSPTPTSFGIDPSGAPTLIPAGGVFRQESSDNSIETFNGDGTGTTVGRSKTMNISNFNVGFSTISRTEFTIPFTYVVNDDDTVDIRFGVGTATTILGAGAGNIITVGPRSARAQIAAGGKIIVSAPATTIEQETLFFQVPNDGSSNRTRLCTRSSTAAKLNGGDRDND